MFSYIPIPSSVVAIQEVSLFLLPRNCPYCIYSRGFCPLLLCLIVSDNLEELLGCSSMDKPCISCQIILNTMWAMAQISFLSCSWLPFTSYFCQKWGASVYDDRPMENVFFSALMAASTSNLVLHQARNTSLPSSIIIRSCKFLSRTSPPGGSLKLCARLYGLSPPFLVLNLQYECFQVLLNAVSSSFLGAASCLLPVHSMSRTFQGQHSSSICSWCPN
jgi:hypothetical protein